MPVSQRTLSSIKEEIRVEEVIGDFVSLGKKGSGRNLWACCPLPGHNEQTPSFSVHPEKGFWKCFGCGESGDAITFLRKVRNMSYLEAMQHLAQKYNIPWEVEKGESKDPVQRQREKYEVLMSYAQQYYEDKLTHSRLANTYLATRQIPEALQKRFHLGYSPNEWRGWHDFAREKGYEVSDLSAVGLVVQREERCYDLFRGRLMFPVHNSLGQVVGFGGRQLTEEKEAPKYINSPESILYQKSDLLYGLYQAKESIRVKQRAFLVEGYTDVIAMHQHGLPQAVAAAGTSLTTMQVALLKRFTNQVILVLDNDEAGIKATLRAGDLLLQQNIDVRVVLLPSGEDPASYGIKVGSSAFQAYLKEQEKDFITFKASLWRASAAESPEQHIKGVHEVINSIALMPDPIKREVYIDLCTPLLKINKEALYQALAKRLRLQQVESTPRRRKAFNATKIAQLPEESAIMRLLLRYGEKELSEHYTVASYLFEELEDITFTTPAYQTIYNACLTYWENHQKLDIAALLQEQRDEIKKVMVNIMAAPYSMSQVWAAKCGALVPKTLHLLAEAAERVVLKLKLKIIQRMMRKEQESLIGVTDPAIADEKLASRQVLKEVEMTIAKKLGVVIYPA